MKIDYKKEYEKSQIERNKMSKTLDNLSRVFLFLVGFGAFLTFLGTGVASKSITVMVLSFVIYFLWYIADDVYSIRRILQKKE